MSIRVESISRSSLLEMITEAEGDRLTEEHAKYFDEFIRAATTTWVGLIDEKLIGAIGLIPPSLLSDRTYIWFYHSPELVQDHVFMFVRHSQRVVEELLKEYSVLYGHTEVRAKQSIRWLRWLGAEYGQPEGKMIPFVIRKKNND